MLRNIVDFVGRFRSPICMINLLGILSCLLSMSSAAKDIGWIDDTDLTSFVTRPEIKSPKFKVTKYDPDHIVPGYWFIGPYAAITQQQHPQKYYQPCQTGPAIYDGNGDLVWSGACLVENQNTCDFRPYYFNDTYYLSGIRYKVSTSAPHWRGDGFLMDNSYRIIRDIEHPVEVETLNMHEMKIMNNGTRVLYIYANPERADLRPLEANLTAGWIVNLGFKEFDLVNNKTLFDWMAYPHVGLEESYVPTNWRTGKDMDHQYNFFHANSLDKNSDGDYIFNSRYTDTIYKISGQDGKILWRLGGKRSDFNMEGFNFSRQHDARWVEHNDKYEIVSLLDNGGDEVTQISNFSSGITVHLNKTTMSAHVLNRWRRPGRRQSLLRGNFQSLPNGNWFGAWSDNCHLSEHTSDGRLLMEAEFQSDRFVTYRAWKGNFTAMPEDAPILKAFAYGSDAQKSVVVYYTSWNGATEVASWNFYREGKMGATLLGNAERTGFETQFHSIGYPQERVFVEAVDKNGRALGRSSLVDVEDHVAWTRESPVQPQRNRTEAVVAKTEL